MTRTSNNGTITGTITGGYTLAPGYSTLYITGTGKIIGAAGGVALVVENTGFALINNNGSLAGGLGVNNSSAPGGAGGAGLQFNGYGIVNDGTGAISGGAGGTGVYGGAGGAGVVLSANGHVNNTGLNAQTRGGAGGAGTYRGGLGGAGIQLTGGSRVNTIYVAAGSSGDRVIGGAGGNAYSRNGTGGQGGAGIFADTYGTVDNYGYVYGGFGGGAYLSGSVNAGGKGGAGVDLSAGGTLDNFKTIGGGAGGGYNQYYSRIVIAQTGGAGVLLFSSGTVHNSGVIFGGDGGSGHTNGAGGAGLFNEYDVAVINNSGQIRGGIGGVANAFGYDKGGAGGSGMNLTGLETVTNSGKISGGAGGSGSYGSQVLDVGGPGGAGGAGITLSKNQSLLGLETVNNTGAITGGAGGSGGNILYKGSAGVGGTGGAGVLMVTTAVVANNGTIAGGAGGLGGSTPHSGRGPDGSSGDGIVMSKGGVVTNGARTTTTALITGLVGVYAGAGGPATVTNFGIIQGTGGVAVQFKSATDKLIAESGSTWIGSVQGGGGLLDLANGSGTVTGIGSTGTVSVAESITFGGFGSYEFGKGVWTLAGTNTLGASQTIVDKAKVTSTGALTLNGAISSTGSLTIAGGTAAIDGVATITVANWSLTGGVTSVNESRALIYKGVFNETSGATLTVLQQSRLLLSGAATLSGLINGAGDVSVINATIGKGLVVGGTTRLVVNGSAIQSGAITIGDATPSSAALFIYAGATWTIAGAFGIARGASAASRLEVGGTLIKAGTSGVSTIQLMTADTGMIEAAAGTLDMASTLTGSGGLKIDSGAVLEIDGAADKGLTATFNGSGATLALSAPTTFASTIAGFEVGDTIDLLKIAATGASINAKDQLVIVNGAATVASLQLSGAYSGATFTIGSDKHGGTSITLLTAAGAPPAAASPAPSAQAMVAAMAGLGAGAGSVETPTAHPDHMRLMLSIPPA